tara:strand:- start:389 stop:697 length:309 start_codon:yes stop_codon:yes gene_type:complete
MSGTSGTEKCYNCGSEGFYYYDWRPFTTNSFECYICGFITYTSDGYLNLEELNRARSEHNENMDLAEGDEGYLLPLTQEEYDAIERKSSYMGTIDPTILRKE